MTAWSKTIPLQGITHLGTSCRLNRRKCFKRDSSAGHVVGKSRPTAARITNAHEYTIHGCMWSHLTSCAVGNNSLFTLDFIHCLASADSENGPEEADVVMATIGARTLQTLKHIRCDLKPSSLMSSRMRAPEWHMQRTCITYPPPI